MPDSPISLDVTLSVGLSVLAILLLSGFSVHILYRRATAPLGSVLPIVFLAALLFSIGDLAVTLASHSPELYWAGLTVLYTGLLVFAPAWLIFSLRYTQLYAPGFLPELRFALWVPVALNGVLWVIFMTNPWHGSFLVTNPGGQSDYGVFWYVTASSNYIMITATLFLQFVVSRRAKDSVIRSQSRFIMAGTVTPLIASMLFVFNRGLFTFDPTAFAFCLSCGIFLFAIHRLNLFVLQGVSLRDVLGGDTDAVLVGNTEKRLMYANPAAIELFEDEDLIPGVSLDELFERRLPSLVLEPVGRRGRDVVTVGGSHEFRFEKPGGDTRFIVAEMVPLAAGQSQSRGFCLRLRDRTALREASRAIETQVALLEGVDLATGEAVLVTDRMGTVRYVNEAFPRLWGLPPGRVLNEKYEYLQEAFRELLPSLPARIFDRPWHEDLTHRSTDDVRLPDGRVVEVTTIPVDHAPGFSGRVWRMVDVTQARREQHAMLHTQKLEGLGVLAGGIAHDFNNLLVSMLGNAELARTELDHDSPVQPYLVDVEAAADRARELTSQLLAYTGKGKFVLETLDLSELVRSVTELLSVSIPKKVSIQYSLTKDLPAIRGGAGQLRQIVMNLVTNAADAMGGDLGVIRLETGFEEPPPLGASQASVTFGEKVAQAVYVRVTDNGIGMNQETLSRIFDPFFTTKFAGRGLGLAATQGIIGSHNGALQVDSEPGRGSVFTVYLPVEKEPRVETSRRRPVATSGAALRSVLVVDDEENVRVVTRRILESAGLEVRTARDGVEGLNLYRQHGKAIDLVLLDLTMPKLSGEETWRKLKKINPEVRVLLCSGYTKEDANPVLDDPDSNVSFIQKPFRRLELLDRIESLLVTTHESVEMKAPSLPAA